MSAESWECCREEPRLLNATAASIAASDRLWLQSQHDSYVNVIAFALLLLFLRNNRDVSVAPFSDLIGASTLAQQCGYHPAPNFYGDVFVGRVSSKNGLHNVDIEDADVIDSTKPWIRQAVQENVLWQQAVNKATGREGESQPDHAGTEGVGVRVESEDGAEGCAYVWMQNEEEVEMTVHLSNKVGEGSKANKALVRVGFQPQKITVKYDKETVLEVHLYSKLDVDGCTWTLDRCNLVITGEKASEGEMWPRLQLSG